jgi:hypothetical protein
MVYTESTMKKLSGHVVSVNILGLLGYMSSLLAWLLIAATFFVLLADSSFMTMPNDQPFVERLAIPDNLTGVAAVASYGVAIVAIIVTIIIFMTFPYFISENLSRFMRYILKTLKIAQEPISYLHPPQTNKQAGQVHHCLKHALLPLPAVAEFPEVFEPGIGSLYECPKLELSFVVARLTP